MDKYAIFSVTNKKGIVELGNAVSKSHKIIASGGTARTLKNGGVPVIEVSDYTGFPEILQGRVKTLHPKIHGGILFRDTDSDIEEIEDLGIGEIDLVVVNFYKFRDNIDRSVRLHDAVEEIDIGGPTLVRAAAKNYSRVSVVVDPDDYDDIIEMLPDISETEKLKLAAKAFSLVAEYDVSIAKHMNKSAKMQDSMLEETMDKFFFLEGRLDHELRYGENPHQKAAYYKSENRPFYKYIQGEEPSYNNLIDMHAGWNLVKELDDSACVIVKHRNPSGAASADTQKQAYFDALSSDSKSAFGGVYVFNEPISKETANELVHMFVDVLFAPDYDDGVLDILKQKEKMTVLTSENISQVHQQVDRIPGGFVVQNQDVNQLSSEQMIHVSKLQPDNEVIEELKFAWKLVKHARSNAAVISTGTRSLGIGSGNVNRVDAVKQAIERAGDEVEGAVMASDAFFPFPDSIELAAEAGIKAIISPKGSIRDDLVINAANDHGIILVFTKVRAFKH